MKEVIYPTQGVCSKAIRVVLDDNNVIQEAQILGGCSGNTQGVASLLQGMKVEDAISRLEGIRCGMKSTSCPDQLAQALKLYANAQP